jgi:hypothetical protein
VSGGPDERDARRGSKESAAQVSTGDEQRLVDGLRDLLDEPGGGEPG